MNPASFLLPAFLALGVGGSVAAPSTDKPAAIASENSSAFTIQPHLFGGFDLAGPLFRDCGMSQAAFGQTDTCRRMMRASKMRRCGIRGSRI